MENQFTEILSKLGDLNGKDMKEIQEGVKLARNASCSEGHCHKHHSDEEEELKELVEDSENLFSDEIVQDIKKPE
jgi:hypothetical protein